MIVYYGLCSSQLHMILIGRASIANNTFKYGQLFVYRTDERAWEILGKEAEQDCLLKTYWKEMPRQNKSYTELKSLAPNKKWSVIHCIHHKLDVCWMDSFVHCILHHLDILNIRWFCLLHPPLPRHSKGMDGFVHCILHHLDIWWVYSFVHCISPSPSHSKWMDGFVLCILYHLDIWWVDDFVHCILHYPDIWWVYSFVHCIPPSPRHSKWMNGFVLCILHH